MEIFNLNKKPVALNRVLFVLLDMRKKGIN